MGEPSGVCPTISLAKTWSPPSHYLWGLDDLDLHLDSLTNLITPDKLPNQSLLEFVDGPLSSCGDAALRRPFTEDIYTHKSSPQPVALPDEGEKSSRHDSGRVPIPKYFTSSLPLTKVLPLRSSPPGFRFCPTDEELISHYLRSKINDNEEAVIAIPEVDVCKYEPNDLPDMSLVGTNDEDWFFFYPKDRNYSKRATPNGYWKATGKDRMIRSGRGTNTIGMKKTLVFYYGRATKGQRTDWVIHEYSVTSKDLDGTKLGQGSFVLCKLSKTPGRCKRIQDDDVGEDFSSPATIKGEAGRETGSDGSGELTGSSLLEFVDGPLSSYGLWCPFTEDDIYFHDSSSPQPVALPDEGEKSSLEESSRNDSGWVPIPKVFTSNLPLRKVGPLRTLPAGYRFRPTDEEIINYYLRFKINGNEEAVSAIPEVDVYKYEPNELPDMSLVGTNDGDWFFFCPKDLKYPKDRNYSKRATPNGYWKATGRERTIKSGRGTNIVGLKKTLVFYSGRAPAGQKTNWVIHEYHATSKDLDGTKPGQRSFVLCKLIKKHVEKLEGNQVQDFCFPSTIKGEAGRETGGDGGGELRASHLPQKKGNCNKSPHPSVSNTVTCNQSLSASSTVTCNQSSSASSTMTHVKSSSWKGFEELGMDPENTGIISDLKRFKVGKELFKLFGKSLTRFYFLYDPPGADRSSLIAAMADYLEYRIHNLDVTSFSSLSELRNMLASITNSSLIWIQDSDQCAGMLPDLNTNELMDSCLLKFVDGLLLSRGDERIIVFTTNNRDLHDAALRRPFNKDIYIHKSSPQPVALPAEGEIVQLNSFEQKPLVDFDATNSGAHQSSVFVSNPEKKNTREISKRRCMTESVRSLIDSTTRISSTDFDTPDNKAHLLRAHQSSPIVFNSEKKDTIEGLRGECLTKNVPSLDDSRKQESLLDFDATENKAHLFRAYQIDSVVSLSENKNRGEALKSNVQSLLGLEDLQQHCGDRRDAAAKTFGAIYDPGFHTPDSLAWKSFEVLETLPTEEQPIDFVPLLAQGRLPLEGCVQQEKSPDLPRIMQINGVEQRVTKMPRYLGGLTAQSASSSRWPISLPDGGHIVLLDPLDQSTKNIEHVARADQCSPTVFLAEKKMVRKCRTMSVIFEENHLHFGKRCEGASKSLGAMCICRKHGINQQCTLKQIHKQHGIHQWPFRQKWATRKGYSLGDSLAWKSFKVQDNLPLGEQSNTRWRSLTHKHCVRLKKSQDLPRSMLRDCAGGLAAQFDIGLPDGGHILSLSEKKIVRKTLKRKCRTMSVLSLEDHQQHVGRRWEDTVKFLGAKRICRQLVIHRETTAKRIRRQLGTRWWLFKQSAIGLPDGGHILYLPEKKIFRKTLKRKCRSISVLSLEDHKQHVDRRWEDAAKSHGTKCIRRQLVIHRLSTAKRTHKQHGIHQWPFQRSAISLPDGGHILSLSEKKIVRKTLKRKCRSMSVLCLVDRQQHVDRRWEDAAKNIGAKRICRQLVIHRVSIAKRICRQHEIHHRWPFERDWATMKGYSLGDERPVEVISLSTHAKFVLRLQLIYISWLGSFSPRLSALPGREILGPIALSSSEFAATKNIAQRVGQDRSGSASSDSENERTREQEDPREVYTSITKDDLLQFYGRMNRKDAAASLGVSVSTFKRKCRDYRIDRWPHIRKKKVGRPPDQHGERNTSTACKTPLHNVHARMEGEPVGQNQEANEFRRDFMEHSIALNTENDSIIALYSETEAAARGSSKWAFQLEDQTMQSTTYPYCDDLVFSQSQIASTEVVNENMGSLQDRRDLLASQVVAPQKEPLLEGHVFGIGNWTVGSCSDLASSQTMRTFSHATGSSENLENWLASVEEHLMEENIYGSSRSDPAPSQPMRTIHHSMATMPHMMPLPIERQDTRSVKLKATYGDTKIKFQFPLTSGINVLKEVMSKILERELGSFKVEYKDEDGEWILMALDEHVREYLQLLNSLGNKVTELKVQDKVPNTTNFCANCRCYNRRSLKRKRP